MKILIVSDDKASRIKSERTLREAGYDVISTSCKTALQECGQSIRKLDVALVDDQSPYDRQLRIIPAIRSQFPEIAVFAVNRSGEYHQDQAAMDGVKATINLNSMYAIPLLMKDWESLLDKEQDAQEADEQKFKILILEKRGEIGANLRERLQAVARRELPFECEVMWYETVHGAIRYMAGWEGNEKVKPPEIDLVITEEMFTGTKEKFDGFGFQTVELIRMLRGPNNPKKIIMISAEKPSFQFGGEPDAFMLKNPNGFPDTEDLFKVIKELFEL